MPSHGDNAAWALEKLKLIAPQTMGEEAVRVTEIFHFESLHCEATGKADRPLWSWSWMTPDQDSSAAYDG